MCKPARVGTWQKSPPKGSLWHMAAQRGTAISVCYRAKGMVRFTWQDPHKRFLTWRRTQTVIGARGQAWPSALLPQWPTSALQVLPSCASPVLHKQSAAGNTVESSWLTQLQATVISFLGCVERLSPLFMLFMPAFLLWPMARRKRATHLR